MTTILHRIAKNEWMNDGFASFLTAFQSYQGNGSVIMKEYVEGSFVYAWKYFCYQRPRTRNHYISRPVFTFELLELKGVDNWYKGILLFILNITFL